MTHIATIPSVMVKDKVIHFSEGVTLSSIRITDKGRDRAMVIAVKPEELRQAAQAILGTPTPGGESPQATLTITEPVQPENPDVTRAFERIRQLYVDNCLSDSQLVALIADQLIAVYGINYREAGGPAPEPAEVEFKKGDWVVPHSETPMFLGWDFSTGERAGRILRPTPQKRVLEATDENPLQVTRVDPDGNLTLGGAFLLHKDSAKKLTNYQPPIARPGEYVQGVHSGAVFKVKHLKRSTPSGRWVATLITAGGQKIQTKDFHGDAYKPVEVEVVPPTRETWKVRD